jgi:hypothetical protein
MTSLSPPAASLLSAGPWSSPPARAADGTPARLCENWRRASVGHEIVGRLLNQCPGGPKRDERRDYEHQTTCCTSSRFLGRTFFVIIPVKYRREVTDCLIRGEIGTFWTCTGVKIAGDVPWPSYSHAATA